ncbi:MAG: oleate hydratase [Ignavibacteria bacterium]|nr:oleate hydratase [Ignavibacteria bacterium]
MKRIIIIGGGVAGLASATFLADKGFEIILFESAPKLGGRCYSFFNEKNGCFIDNGKHLIAGWYHNFRKFLELTGSADNFTFQKKFNVSFLNEKNKTDKIYLSSNPFGFLFSFLRSDIFSKSDLIPFYRLLKKIKNENLRINKFPASEFIKELGFSENTINLFWKPVSISIFNTRLENVGTGIFTEVLKRGFDSKGNYLLGYPKTDSYNAFIKNTESFLQRHSVLIKKNCSVKRINFSEGNITDIVTEDSNIVYADYFILAIPFYAYKNVFSENICKKHFSMLQNLKTSSIINFHLFLKEKVPSVLMEYRKEMLGFHNSLLQWLFVNSDKHINISISGASEISYKNSALIDIEKNTLFDIVLNNLKLYIKSLDRNDIADYIVIKEKRATYIQDSGSIDLRKFNGKLSSNMFIAGDWTKTYLPSTLESAALSAKICTDKIINFCK